MRIEDCKVGMRVKTITGAMGTITRVYSQMVDVDLGDCFPRTLYPPQFDKADPTPEEIFEATIKAFVP